MDQVTFQATVAARASKSIHPENVGAVEFFGAINAAIAALQRVDEVKAALFYDRKNKQLVFPGDKTLYELEYISPDLVHAILGVATEGGELLERLKKMLLTTSTLSEHYLNLKEELGDVEWFMGLAYTSLGLDRAEVLAANDRKLEKRFGPAFSEDRANNRDLPAEAKALDND